MHRKFCFSPLHEHSPKGPHQERHAVLQLTKWPHLLLQESPYGHWYWWGTDKRNSGREGKRQNETHWLQLWHDCSESCCCPSTLFILAQCCILICLFGLFPFWPSLLPWLTPPCAASFCRELHKGWLFYVLWQKDVGHFRESCIY